MIKGPLAVIAGMFSMFFVLIMMQTCGERHHYSPVDSANDEIIPLPRPRPASANQQYHLTHF